MSFLSDKKSDVNIIGALTDGSQTTQIEGPVFNFVALSLGSGTISSLGGTVTYASPGSLHSIQLSGTFNATLQFEQSNDGVNWFPLLMVKSSGGASVSNRNAADLLTADVYSAQIRVRASAYSSGTVKVDYAIR